MSKPKLLAFSGSARKGSFNQTLVEIAAQGATASGADVQILNLGDYGLPVFNQDFESESGIPEGAIELKELFKASNGFLISSPEYNSSLTALLKNTIDWISRPVDGEAPLEAFTGKVAGLMAASPGGLGGLRGLVHLRAILQNINVMVVPNQMAISSAHDAFDSDGNLKNEKQQSAILKIGEHVTQVATKIIN